MEPNSVIVITGGASGIGLATAELSLTRGWKTAVLDVNPNMIDDARTKLSIFDKNLYCASLDICDENAVISTFRDIADNFGVVRGIVNSAGIVPSASVMDTSTDLFKRALEVNLVGTFVISREAVKYMLPAGGGSIVNVASVAGLRGYPNRAAYSASKGGVVALTREMAVELAKDGIRVNAVAPGPVETPMTESFHSPSAHQNLIRTIPLGRYGKAREIAEVIAFLLDPIASSFVTAQIVAADGGATGGVGWTAA